MSASLEMFVIIRGTTKAINRLGFLSHGLLICLLTRFFLISPKNAGQRMWSKCGRCALCVAVHLQEIWAKRVNMDSINYQYYLCREKQINLYLQKYLTKISMYSISERLVICVNIVVCFAKFRRIIFSRHIPLDMMIILVKISCKLKCYF